MLFPPLPILTRMVMLCHPFGALRAPMQHANRPVWRRLSAGLLFAGLGVLGNVQAAPTCCGPVSAQGQVLQAQLDASGVDHLWLPGQRVRWDTGQATDPLANDPDTVPLRGHTHCSAFVAAFLKQQGVYVLRPPQHPAKFLATAQIAWLHGPQAQAQGWRVLDSAQKAQSLANQGHWVLAAFPSQRADRPGHIAIVRPAALSDAQLEADGPQLTQAGQRNALSISAREGFRAHPLAWPQGLQYFAFQPKESQPATAP